MNKFVKMLAASVLCSFASNAQITAGLEGGTGWNFYNTSKHLPADGAISKKPVENLAITASILTAGEGRVNYGGQLSFVRRDFGIYSFGNDDDRGSGSFPYSQSYVYLTPTMDVALDRKKYMHVQALLPVGLLVGGSEKKINGVGIADARTRINYRYGLSFYGQLPISGRLCLTAKTEYTASFNKSTYFLDDASRTRASEFVLKVGMNVKLY